MAEAEGTVWEMPLFLAAITGARRGEVLAIGWNQIDLENRRVKVSRSLERTRASSGSRSPRRTAATATLLYLDGPRTVYAVGRSRRMSAALRPALHGGTTGSCATGETARLSRPIAFRRHSRGSHGLQGSRRSAP